MNFFPAYFWFPPPAEDHFSRSQLPGTQGAPVYLTAQAWVPGGFSIARALSVQSRDLASNCGEVFRPARAKHVYINPELLTCPCFHHRCSLVLVLKYRSKQHSKARKLRYHSRASSFSLCDSHERCCCVCTYRTCACLTAVQILGT